MKNADKPAIAAIVTEMLGSRETMPNEEMAQVVFTRLGVKVSRNDISGLRTEMGVNMYQRIERDVQAALQEGAEKLRRQFQAEGVGDVPWLALATIVTLRWDNEELAARKREVSERNRELSDALAGARQRLKAAKSHQAANLHQAAR